MPHQHDKEEDGDWVDTWLCIFAIFVIFFVFIVIIAASTSSNSHHWGHG